MNTLDVIALLIIGLSALTALIKGLTGELFWIAGVIGGFLLATQFYSTPAFHLVEAGLSPTVAGFLSFVGIFLGTAALSAMASSIAARFLKTVRLRWMDRLLGGTFGLIRGSLIVAVAFLAMAAFPLAGDAIEESALAPYFLNGARALAAMAPQDFEDLFESGYQRLRRSWLVKEAQQHAKGWPIDAQSSEGSDQNKGEK